MKDLGVLGLLRLTFAVMVLGASCTASAPAARERPTPNAERTRDGLEGALQPYAFTTPTPADAPTPVDAIYVRRITEKAAGGPPVPCRRCAPYRIDAGVTTLVLRHGRYAVSHPRTRFRSSGHFLVSGETVVFFNDPNCTDDRGTYRWSLTGSSLSLRLVEDPCAFGLRGRYLTAFAWTKRT